MIDGVAEGDPEPETHFRHEAFFYSGDSDFVSGATAFIREAIGAGEPVMVVVTNPKMELLRESLGGDTNDAMFIDMAEVGRNPARIIPVWHDFVAAQAKGGRSVRGIGEPIWPGRSAAEIVECERHESLLNLAFGGGMAWRLLCPYDTSTLDPTVIASARRNHPLISNGASPNMSPSFDPDLAVAPFDAPLADPLGSPVEVEFQAGPLHDLRVFVAQCAQDAGLDEVRAADFVLAAHEIATNSVRHGGGRGTLRVWQDGDIVVCEVRDEGRLALPLAGRRRPGADGSSGRGLWLVNQLCDLVQMRSFPTGTVVRIHMSVRS